LITLKNEEANVFKNNEKKFVACMTKILETFKPDQLNRLMNQIGDFGLLKEATTGDLVPFV